MYKKDTHIHFIGIGGIGMSAIAKILKTQGYTVSGCDLDKEQRTIQELINLGCKISFEHNSQMCNDHSVDVLVHSTAVKPNNPEIVNAINRNIPVVHRSIMLAEIMKHKYSIAISGSHGKTTTTAMISHILIQAQMDPTIVVGGHLKSISENAKFGQGEFLVVEADESDRSFENLHPALAVVTNIDLEHLETYSDIEDIKYAFKNFLNNLPFYGKAILCIDDNEVKSIIPELKNSFITYGIDNEADLYANDLEIFATHSTFDLWQKNNFLGTVNINMPGKHNILNSLAAIAISMEVGIDFETIAEALKSFQGIERRFSYNGQFKGAEIFDDYGHHPNEIINTLAVAKKRAKGKLHVVFQPHRYTRTNKLWNQFISAFVDNQIDSLIITDIFPASETPIANINGQNLVKDIKQKRSGYPVTYLSAEDDFSNIIEQLKETIGENDLLLLLGAGKVNKIAGKLIKK